MISNFTVTLPGALYNRLKLLAEANGQSVEAYIEEALEDAISDEGIDGYDAFPPAMLSSPQTLPPHGSPEEDALRDTLAVALSRGPSLTQLLREERDER